MIVFIFIWPYLLTTKLRCLQKNTFGHTNVLCRSCKYGKFEESNPQTSLYSELHANDIDFSISIISTAFSGLNWHFSKVAKMKAVVLSPEIWVLVLTKSVTIVSIVHFLNILRDISVQWCAHTRHHLGFSLRKARLIDFLWKWAYWYSLVRDK